MLSAVSPASPDHASSALGFQARQSQDFLITRSEAARKAGLFGNQPKCHDGARIGLNAESLAAVLDQNGAEVHRGRLVLVRRQFQGEFHEAIVQDLVTSRSQRRLVGPGGEGQVAGAVGYQYAPK